MNPELDHKQVPAPALNDAVPQLLPEGVTISTLVVQSGPAEPYRIPYARPFRTICMPKMRSGWAAMNHAGGGSSTVDIDSSCHQSSA